jgi:hypothetical protein
MMPLGPLGAGLPARAGRVICAATDDFRKVRAEAREAASLRSRSREAIGGVVLGAVAARQHFEAAASSATGRPVGVPPRGTDRVALAPTMLLEPADDTPAVVTQALEQGF